MGEPEQVIAEPDETEGEDVEGLHPPTLQQQNPRFLTHAITSATSFLAANGWYAVGIFLLGCIAWIQFGPKVQSWLRKREEEKEAAKNYREPDAFLAKQRAIDEARRRMQEQYNIAAAISLEKKKEMMEKKKEEKIKEWENKQPSGGRTLRSPDSSSVSASASSAKGKSAPKARLRPEPDASLAKQRAIDEARRRMQEQYNIAAAISLEKKKEMMEKKKEEKIKEWENKQPSGGRTLRSPDSSTVSASASSAKGKSAPKARLRPEYNPMTGDTGASSSCRWRPSAQRPSGGG